LANYFEVSPGIKRVPRGGGVTGEPGGTGIAVSKRELSVTDLMRLV